MSGEQPTTGAARGRLWAGDLEIDLDLARVTRDGAAIPLPRLSFDLLLALAQAAPGYLSHDDLMTRVWPGLVIAEKTLTQRVKLLREALGDDPQNPRYVAGLRGRGYRLATPVGRAEPRSVVSTAVATPAVATPPVAAALPLRLRAWLGRRAAAAVAVATLATGGVAFVVWTNTAAPAVNSAATPAEAGALAPTVAVLPFRDLGGTPRDAYLALAVPEIVLDQLSKVPGLTVIARHSSFKAADDGLDGVELGTRLGARFLIDGTIQRTGDQIRVSAALTDTRSSTQLWAERFDRGIDDIFAIQDEIALRVADALEARIAPPHADQARERPTGVTEAYLAYLEGRTLIARWSIADTAKAERAFARAIEADPSFAAAYAALYDARLMLAERQQSGAAHAPYRPRSWGPGSRLERDRTEHAWLLERALAFDPACGAAYFARATWADLPDAEREAAFRKGLALDPGNARGITAFAEFLDSLDRPEEAKRLLDRAREIDPLSPRPLYWLAMRDWKNTAATIEDDMRRVLELDPDYQPALQRYAKARWWGHAELAEAIQLIERALARDPDNPWLRQTAAAIYLDAEQVDAARQLAHQADRPEISGLMLLRLYEGDRAGAAELAFSDAAFAHGPFENWGAYEAIRDEALHTGDLARAIEYLRQRAELDLGQPMVTALNFRSTPVLAELLLAAGRGQEARRLIDRAIHWIDHVHLARMGKTWALRAKANLQLLDGDSAAALRTLQLAFEAPDYQQWWYTLERDSLWAPFRDDPRFIAIAARVRGHVQSEVVALAALQRAELVPTRGAHQLGGSVAAPHGLASASH